MEWGDNVVKSKTYKVVVGCSNIYITCDFDKDGKIDKIRMQQNNKLHCSLAILKPLFKSVTFETRRDVRQTIKDHKSIVACKMFNIKVKSAMKKGELSAYNCSDAIARVLIKILGDEDEKKMQEKTA